ncbi:MAG: hypothetical protein KJT03_05900, partial [Verrucomicrobiae bacterium]|nr:hypothetical protein [Verrucomicrobiae bacterium]
MKKYLIISLILTASTLFANLASAQFLMASNMEDMDWPLNDEGWDYYVGNDLYAEDRMSLAASGQKIATSFVPDTTAYLNRVFLPLTQVLYTNKSNPYWPDPLWPFGDSYQYQNARSYEIGIFENNGGEVGNLLEKTQMEAGTTFRWDNDIAYGGRDWTGSFKDRGFEGLPFTEAEFSNTTLLQAGESYFLGVAAASNDWGYMYWWHGDESGDAVVAQTKLDDPKPLESDWGALSSLSESANSRAYRIFGTSQGSVV